MKRVLLGALLSLLLSGSAWAAVTATPVFVQTPNVGVQTFIQGTDSAGTFKTVYTGGANGSKCTALMGISNDNGAAHLLTVRIVHSATNLSIVSATIPVSGTANTYGATLSLMATNVWVGLPLDSDGNPYFYLANGDTLQATFSTALTATDQINLMAVCGDF